MMLSVEMLENILEAALMTANKPMTIQHMQGLFEEDLPEKTLFTEALANLAEKCEPRGVELVEVASGWRFQVKQSLTPWVGRLFEEKPQKYSRATLETLALIAYRQPVTRGEIEDVRGVAVSSQIMRTLQEREWIKIVGHRDVPGRPAMYATTREFLDHLGLKSLENLPTLAEIRDLDSLNKELDLKLPDDLIQALGEDEAQEASGPPQDVNEEEQSTEGGKLESKEADEEAEAVELTSDTPVPVLPDDEGFSEMIPIVAVDSGEQHSDIEAPETEGAISVFDEHLDDDLALIDALNADMAESISQGFQYPETEEGTLPVDPSTDDESPSDSPDAD